MLYVGIMMEQNHLQPDRTLILNRLEHNFDIFHTDIHANKVVDGGYYGENKNLF